MKPDFPKPAKPSPTSTLLKEQRADTPPIRSNEDLLEAYAAGDEAAFEDLFMRVGDRLFTFIRRYLGDHHQAEDVYQALCIKVASRAARFERRSSAMTWLYRIARNACLDTLRAEGRRPRISLDGGGRGNGNPVYGHATHPAPNPSAGAEEAELGLAILRAVELLPDEQREVFLLKEEGELSFEEIGLLLDCGKETAKSRMRYALERLRNALGREARLYGLQ
ncbi:MAG: sigma-70 family RNA polymerase sigma factor [Planctomycetota bacterium]